MNNQNESEKYTVTSLGMISQIFVIISAAFQCFFLIPMAWSIPMIVRCSKRLKGEIPITVGHGVLALIFFGIIGGILALIDASTN